jgi:hypothetical protein
MAEYSRMASGQVISNGPAPTPVIVPFIPNYIEISNPTRAAAVSGVTRAWWLTDMGQGAAMVVTTGAGPADGTSFITTTTGTGFTTSQAALALQYGPVVAHGGSPVSDFAINKATSAQITTVGNHGLQSGQVVVFSNLYQTATTGMQQIAGIPFVITVTAATTFTIPWNTSGSNYTAFNTATSTNNVGSYKVVLYPALYAPDQAVISAITLANPCVITTTSPHNFVVGQEVAFRIPTTWGTTQLNSLPNAVIPGSPIYGFVTGSTINTLTVSINSTGFTAFNANQLFAGTPGRTFAQVVPAGDINSGSNQSNFLSPTVFNGSAATAVSTINGPAIAGAYINATFQGFIIGSGVGGTAEDTIHWRAYLHDLNI